MHPNLSFEQAPPLSVPFRFFLTAPLFGIAAGVLLLLQGEGMLASRWIPATLAATHLMVVGFMLQAMCGALLQFVPVAAGGNIWRPQLVAGLVHPLLIAAAGLLCGLGELRRDVEGFCEDRAAQCAAEAGARARRDAIDQLNQAARRVRQARRRGSRN